jgi:NAD(P)-dependent dehydrogenase (short-subunit alcohol dehydrogenase family)
MVADLADQLGGVDILVNAAAMPGGVVAPPKLADITTDALWEEVNTKVMGYLRCAREAAPFMVAGGWGRIINISGLAARQTGSTLGSIRNVAVAAMTKNLADELGPSGINVTVVHPGPTRTERMSDETAARVTGNVIGRVVEADEIAYVVAFLASPKSAAVTGDAIACGGGARGAIHY